jgi:hypothetical protein
MYKERIHLNSRQYILLRKLQGNKLMERNLGTLLLGN